MVYKIEITQTALNDLRTAIKWYNKKDTSIGIRLINNFEISIEKLKKHPQIFTLISDNVRAIEVSKFPYKIFYKFNINYEVIIIALIHTKRSDNYVKRKIRNF
jgi:plasmid stabilization system protein ParE